MAEITIQNVTKEYPNGVVAVNDVSVDIADGEFVVLVGPSGCGKTTLLRSIGGLEKVTAGRISIGDREVTRLEPSKRDLAMVFQNYALYPHMTVRQNLAYGLRVRRTPRKERDERVHEVARLLELGELLDRRPGQLSGGQQQRVAMGRAIIRQPAAYLMDEPLSNLDAKLRVSMRGEIHDLQRRLGTTTVYVTHDQVEAMTMGDRIAVMSDGVIKQLGTPKEVYEDPRNVFVASFVGSPAMNLVPAPIVDAGGSSLIAGLRPEHIEVANGSGDSIRFSAQIGAVEYLGEEQLVHLVTKDTSLVAKLPAERQLSSGEERTFSVPRRKLFLFDRESENRVN
ncbi:MAG TPA: sn-glycerol-3-phosphate ABC transporter ATP-binding protein UgpC [Gaiellaceae bacterium]|jgi:sn-glycerol 3-phosphate transport system ATP-binding protein|nr:sn-glycerol-3-phosphate ABC transporter ATP-binding protein UgpC [Gaiellaceae bacterium]